MSQVPHLNHEGDIKRRHMPRMPTFCVALACMLVKKGNANPTDGCSELRCNVVRVKGPSLYDGSKAATDLMP